MKIAFVQKKFTIHGGAGRYAADFINNLIEKGYEVHVFANQWDKEEDRKVHFHYIPMIKGLSLLKLISFVVFSHIIISRYKFEIIHTNDRIIYKDIYLASDGCHKIWLKNRNKHVSSLKKILIKINPLHHFIPYLEKILFMKRNYKKIIAVSRRSKKEIVENYNIPETDIEVIYHGVDINRFHPRNVIDCRRYIRAEYGIDPKDFLILFVGSGFERKGLSFLIKSLCYLDKENVKLLIVGKGNNKAYLKIHKKLGLRDKIIFAGVKERIEDFYCAADVYVLPTLYEPFGLSVLESMACGIPVITSKMCGASEILTHGENGLIIDRPDNPREIVANIKLLFDETRRYQMGKKARERAEEFTDEVQIEKTLNIYNEIIKMKQY